jgi:hypothetical protein
LTNRSITADESCAYTTPVGARQKLGAVAGVRLHIQHLHAGLDAGEGEHPGRLATLIGLPIAIAAVRRGDDGIIVRYPEVLRHGRDRA